MDMVAVLIPCYNEAKTIEKVVKDYLKVLPENSKIYVYDNNSSDGTGEIAEKGDNRMLNIFYGDMKEAVYNTAAYFKYDYEDSWIIDPFVKEMVQDVDRSTVLDSGVIDSPVLGKIPPTGLSGGVKTLILVKFEKDKIFNASTCGDNCAKWLLKIAASQDRTINLHHLMEFGEEPFQIRILNTDQVVCSMRELISIAGEFV